MPRAAPLHPILVHFTIALVATSLAIDLVVRIVGVSSLLTAAWWTIAAASVITIGTVATGVLSRRHVAIAEGAALGYLRFHAALGPTFLGCLIATTLWRATFWSRAIPPNIWYLIALGSVTIMMTVQGYLGGELVYRFGVGVRSAYTRLPLHRDDAPAE